MSEKRDPVNYQHFIIIRFNLKIKQSQWKHPITKWNIGRLNSRFFLFENICLPSLINQKLKNNFHVILLISHDLPKKFRRRLENITNKYNFIHLEIVKDKIFYNHICFLKKYLSEDTQIIATTRMDDDDALNPIFSTCVSKYIQKNISNDYFITFPNGYWLNLDRKNKKLTYLEANKKFIACGLTRVSSVDCVESVYCGNHNEVGQKGLEVICDRTPGIYSVTNHSFNDSKNRLLAFSKHKDNRNLDKIYYASFPFVNKNKLLFNII